MLRRRVFGEGSGIDKTHLHYLFISCISVGGCDCCSFSIPSIFCSHMRYLKKDILGKYLWNVATTRSFRDCQALVVHLSTYKKIHFGIKVSGQMLVSSLNIAFVCTAFRFRDSNTVLVAGGLFVFLPFIIQWLIPVVLFLQMPCLLFLSFSALTPLNLGIQS